MPKPGEQPRTLPWQCPTCRAEPGEKHTVDDFGDPCPGRAKGAIFGGPK